VQHPTAFAAAAALKPTNQPTNQLYSKIVVAAAEVDKKTAASDQKKEESEVSEVK
jgi:hypothetical protein